jgi:hypothetical protein
VSGIKDLLRAGSRIIAGATREARAESPHLFHLNLEAARTRLPQPWRLFQGRGELGEGVVQCGEAGARRNSLRTGNFSRLNREFG